MITIYAFIGDLHLCAGKLPRKDYVESLKKFLGIIKDHKEPCHAIFVIGDLFDHKLSVEELEFASAFMLALVCNHCGREAQRHVPVYFIHGTYAHDYEQYAIFMPMLEQIENTHVNYTSSVCETKLKNGVRVLCLPQEYGDVDYTEYFNKEYDIIVGHGPLSSMTQNPCKSTKYEIMHSAEQLGAISKICVFGHFHGYTDFGNNVFYTGPWLRWKYGEPTKRVFFFCNDNFEVETVPNEIAQEYETFDVYAPDELRGLVSGEIKNPHRFVIHAKSEDLPDYYAIMNLYKKNPYIRFQLTTVEEEEKIEELIETEHITKPIVEPIPALIEYVKDKYDVDVTEEVKEYENRINKDKPE